MRVPTVDVDDVLLSRRLSHFYGGVAKENFPFLSVAVCWSKRKFRTKPLAENSATTTLIKHIEMSDDGIFHGSTSALVAIAPVITTAYVQSISNSFKRFELKAALPLGESDRSPDKTFSESNCHRYASKGCIGRINTCYQHAIVSALARERLLLNHSFRQNGKKMTIEWAVRVTDPHKCRASQLKRSRGRGNHSAWNMSFVVCDKRCNYCYFSRWHI